MRMGLNLSQIGFCAEECERQQSGEMSVARMCTAYSYALELCPTVVTIPLIIELGRFVEPEKNKRGFREVPVYFHHVPTKLAVMPSQILQGITSLLENGQHLSAGEKYHEFQKIHPFLDGNGRVGAILYNIYWIGDKNKEKPIPAPNFFG